MIKRISIIALCLLCGTLFGYVAHGINKYLEKQNDLDITFGTIQGLSRALEDIKLKTGTYPDSIKTIDGSVYTKEPYSVEIASRTLYIKTSKGYYLVSGAPEAIISSDQSDYINHLMSHKPFVVGSGLKK
jgi:hypothetical protein